MEEIKNLTSPNSAWGIISEGNSTQGHVQLNFTKLFAGSLLTLLIHIPTFSLQLFPFRNNPHAFL